MKMFKNLLSKLKDKNKILVTFLLSLIFLLGISALILTNYLLIPYEEYVKDLNPDEYQWMTINDVKTARKVDIEELSDPKELGYPWNGSGTIPINSNGILVDFNDVPDKDFIEISADNNDIYKLIYFKKGDAVFGQVINPNYKQSGLSIYKIRIKPQYKDFNRIYIESIGGDGLASIGHIVFRDYHPSFNSILIITYFILLAVLLVTTSLLIVTVFRKHGVNTLSIPEEQGRLFVIIISSAMVMLFVFVFISNSWVAEDAYITFRTVDNFLNGYGLTWNVAERVQAYTHPLWMFVISFSNLVIPSIYYASIVMSFLFCLIAVFRVMFAINRHFEITHIKIIKILLFILLLVSSKSFMDYTTSGLENPLSYLLLVLFYVPIIFSNTKISDYTGSRHFFMFLIASLSFFNRQDTVLLYIPVLVYILVISIKQKRFLKTVGIAVLGTLPATLWLIFSTIYYGFPFPNTAYAKLNTGISSISLLKQGFIYISDCFIFDPITLSFTAVAVVMAFCSKEKKLILPIIGLILYMVYIIKIGGDFMRGRFFALPYLLAVIIIVYRVKSIRKAFLIALLITLISTIHPYSPIKTTDVFPKNLHPNIYRKIHSWGVADEKAFYFQGAGLLMCSKNPDLPSFRWRYEGELNTNEVDIHSAIGYYGYYSGPDCFIIDTFALSDPLMSRLPIKDLDNWRIGHFRRRIPQGYYRSIKSGENQIFNQYLKKYYDKLRLIIRGDLFDKERLKTIIEMNLGFYDSWIDQYIKEDYYK